MTNNAKWCALINDSVVPMPRRVITARLLYDQGAIPSDHVIFRDHVSGSDLLLSGEAEIDLRHGNVFRHEARCKLTEHGDSPSGTPKLAFFVDDLPKIVTNPEQSEGSLRELFNLDPRVELLRDLESPNDTPVIRGSEVAFSEGPVFVSFIEIEKHCDCSHPGPLVRKYRLRIDKEKYTVENPIQSGKSILALAKKNSKEWILNQKVGKHFLPVEPDQKVDLRACGIERFATLPIEQTEGETGRRDFLLPEDHSELLDDHGFNWECVKDSGQCWVLIHGIKVPPGMEPAESSMAIQIPSGYPTAQLDMVYFYPPIVRIDKHLIPCTEGVVSLLGKTWQRWSRHYTSANPWIPGQYNVYTHLRLAISWLGRETLRSVR